MKPENVNSVLLVGSSNISTSLIFQSAVYWAERGSKVLYISTSPFTELPPYVHGTKCDKPEKDAFSKIRFMSLPRWQDLLQHLYSLHQYGNLPRVIIVQELDHYCYPSLVKNEKHDSEMHAALICASLFDAASVCGNYTNQKTMLIASINEVTQVQLESIANNYFNDLAWLLKSSENDNKFTENIRVTKLEGSRDKTSSEELEFTTKSNNFLMLTKIFSTVHNSE